MFVIEHLCMGKANFSFLKKNMTKLSIYGKLFGVCIKPGKETEKICKVHEM